MAVCDPVTKQQFDVVLINALKDFPHVDSVRREQKECLENLVQGKDVFAILPTGFGKSLVFQIFPRLMKGLQRNRHSSSVCTIIVVTPLVAIMKDQVEQLKGMGVSSAAIGVDERADEEAAKNGTCEIVYGSPESWLSREWKRELQEGQLGKQTVAIAIDEVHSVMEW